MSDLTLPGSIPGLLRRCSPIVVHGAGLLDSAGRQLAAFRSQVVGVKQYAPGNGTVSLVVPRSVDWPREDEDGDHDCCHWDWAALDLTDATGRAHAAWWCDERLCEGGIDSEGVCQHELFCLTVRPHDGVVEVQNGLFYIFDDIILDPDDPRTLPDGSRWVDAEALRLVCLHVAGMEAAP